MLRRGLHLPVNSDDPAYFGANLTDNLLAVQGALNLGYRELRQLVENAFVASFLGTRKQQGRLDELRSFCAGYPQR